MKPDYARTYEQLAQKDEEQVSSLFHDRSKLGQTSARGFVAQVVQQSAIAEQEHRVATSLCFPHKRQLALPSVSRWNRGGRLRDALKKRRTRRQFSATKSISSQHWSELLKYGCGVSEAETEQRPQALRTWPSAGALYPIEVFPVVLRPAEMSAAIYHYHAATHCLEVLEELEDPQTIRDLIVCDFDLSQLESIVFLTANIKLATQKYGERGYRFALLEAGHVAQNVLLMCADLNFAAVPLGGFLDNEVATRLDLPKNHSPVYAIGIAVQETGGQER
ncbi:MAG: SagB-type dehydrogenase family enzyme [Pirellulaceae bacterium]|jgi:SagB-type dehydrogenase family enzyme